MSEDFSRRADELTPNDFEGFYTGMTPPWDIGRPQPAFERLLAEGMITGAVLDVGCGTGEHALMAAAAGLKAAGVDAAPTAIAQAVDKAMTRGLDAKFVVGDVLELPAVVDTTFDTVIDSAVFHVFGDEDRARFVEGLHAVLRPGGRYLMLCFSDEVPGTVGPRRISEAEIRATFTDGWSVDRVERTEMQTTEAAVPALLATITRL